MNIRENLYKLWLICIFRDKDYAATYPMLKKLTKQNPKQIFHVADPNNYNALIGAPYCKDCFSFKIETMTVVVAKWQGSTITTLPFDSNHATIINWGYDCYLRSQEEVLVKHGKPTKTITAKNYHKGFPKQLFKLMKKNCPTSNVLYDKIEQHIKQHIK